MRTLLTALCRLLLRIFFRRIEQIGVEQVPSGAQTPVLYVLNHPNALLDPLFIICLSPRPVTFLAKAPLFTTFMARSFVRAFECLPVYRKQDGGDPKQNRASIEASIVLLASGKALALFPEGISHSKPALVPLKTGAARIALSASAATAERQPAPVRIVPVGLCYADKTTFRSNATLIYGPPIETPVVALDARERPPEAAAEALTATIEGALREVSLQAQTHELAELARATARVLSAAERDAEISDGSLPPLEQLELEQRLVDGYEHLHRDAPGRVAALVGRVRAFEAELERLGMPVDHPVALERRRALRWGLARALSLAALALPAALGILTHYLPYRGVDLLAHRLAPGQTQDGDIEDVLASMKMAGGLLLFPLAWIALAGGLALVHRWTSGLAALVLLPACGYAALRFVEILAELIDRARGAWRLVSERDLAAHIARERKEIRAEVLALAQLLP